MKVLILLGLVTLGYARVIDDAFERIELVGYMSRYGIPLAEKIRKAEEAEIIGSRIIGGSVSELGQFPYQAGLLISFPLGTGVCGGSLVNNRRVVTAAHCYWDGINQGRSITVVLGSIRINFGGTRLNAGDNIVLHSNWMPNLVRNDVAVIYLPTTVTFSAIIAPINLPSGPELNDNFVDVRATASGFGRTGDNVPIPFTQVLSHVDLSVISNNICAQTFPGFVQNSNICTSTAEGTGTCLGDSGGPLAVTRGGRTVLIGLTSFGAAAGCAIGYPTVFARASSFVNFFNQNL